MDMSQKSKPIKEVRISSQFILSTECKLGEGSFGQIYKGYNIKTKDEVAIKIESNNCPTPQLMHEYKVLNALKEGEGFPKIFLLTPLDDTLVMVFELVGDNLEKLMRNSPLKHFSLKTVLMLSIQIIKRLQFMHSNFYIHRDIKPENFAIGLKKKNVVIYILDYGLSRKFYDGKKNQHIPYKEGKNLTGTVKFASVYTHMGIEQSRRDDLESLGYMMVYFMKGDLPWSNIKGKSKKDRYNKIKEKKVEVTPDILCEGLDEEFREFFNYVRKLQFEEGPDYQLLIELLERLMKKKEYNNDLEFDWCENLRGRKFCYGESSEKYGNNNCGLLTPEVLFNKLKMGFDGIGVKEDDKKKERENVKEERCEREEKENFDQK